MFELVFLTIKKPDEDSSGFEFTNVKLIMLC